MTGHYHACPRSQTPPELSSRMSHIEVVHLFEQPAHLATVAGWIHQEWWTTTPGHTPGTTAVRLREASSANRIPLSLLALVNGKPAGSVNLIENDDANHPHLTPWLAALLVLPEFRSQGLGSVLVRRCLAEASRLGVTRLYLGTTIPDFYKKLGAEILEPVGTGFWIMRLATS